MPAFRWHTPGRPDTFRHRFPPAEDRTVTHTRVRGAADLLACVVIALWVAPREARAGLVYTGVNLAGAEFGQTSLPGTYNTHYTYPTASEVDYFVGKGLNTFRLPIRWERLQQSQNAALNAAELNRLDTFVNYATGKGAHVIIEPHNFARYYPGTNYQTSTTGVIGSAAVPDLSFADFWSRVATLYKSNDRVIFNLMNEPANVNTDQWVGSANAAIAAIRNAGADNLILVPGTRWTGAWTWNNTDSWGRSNAAAMLDIVDPLAADNIAFDVHQYLDHDGSGTSAQIGTNANPDNTDIGVQRLTAFTNWLHANGHRGFLGEFAVANSRVGAGATQVGDETLVKMLDYLEAHDDVCSGGRGGRAARGGASTCSRWTRRTSACRPRAPTAPRWACSGRT
jgi:endoglucanase